MSGRRYLDEGHKPNVPVFFTAPPELHDAIAGTAEEIGIPVSEFCRTALKAFLADLEEKASEIEREREELCQKSTLQRSYATASGPARLATRTTR